MIGYVTLGTNDLQRAAKYYDTLLGAMGAKRFMGDERFIAWAVSPDKPGIGVTLPFDGKVASVGNGMMVALAVPTPAEVDRMYGLAMSLGSTDEGPPGARGGSGFYAAYFRDLDGNKLNVFCFGQS
jgi:catechol 2,3-dioxygenase-like lactoylglutathione lyase family enzyme